MGIDFFDDYSFSHVLGGGIIQRMGISRIVAYSLSIFYELLENYIWVPYFGGRCINHYIFPIVDCKTKADTIQNMIGDQISFMIGYEFAELIDEKHIPMLPKYFRIFIPILPLLLSLITTNMIGKTPEYEII